ncbi:unnamed protein product, partial [Leptidea sinapis]
MSSYEKLKLLVWKNFLLQRRHKWQTAFEIASPVIFSLFLILIRCLVDPQSKPEISYSPFLPTYFDMTGRQFGNLTTAKREGSLAFSPDNELTRRATEKAMATVALDNLDGLSAFFFNPKMLPEPKGYKNAQELEKALTQPNAMNQILVGIQFDDDMANATQWPDDIKLTLRFPAVMRTPMLEHPLRASWRTNLLFPLFPLPGPRDPADMYGGKTPGYSPELFLAVQHAVSQEIIKEKSGQPINTQVYMQRFPQLAYREDNLLVAMERFISMIIMLCFAYTFVNTVRVVTAEKELQLKETMTIMGLPSWLHWLAWFIKQFSFLMISVVLMVILFKRYSVFTFTPWTVLLFFMLLFVMASLAFCFMVSVFFTRANTAASFMGLMWFSTYAAYFLTQMLYEDVSLHAKFLLSLISNAAIGFFRPGHVVLMLILDTILYMSIAMYVEKIRPGMYGVPLPWYFPFTKKFWMPNKTKMPSMVPPTSGSATINGYDIVSETTQARMSLGLCPQHNVLFPDLTVAEHIIFYSRLKGVPNSRLNDEVNHFVKLLELQEKVVLLDEPTSGLDPAARRSLWDLLQKEKKGRTMILTTHFMDEADILGDRIAIMSGGRLQCVGTPYFLKKHYGIGYKLTIVKEDGCKVQDVTKFFKTYAPDLRENTNIGSELTYIIPNEHVKQFPEMLKKLEEQKTALKISSYGLSVTSLEEVFMKAGAEESDELPTTKTNGVKIYRDTAVVPVENNHNHVSVDSEPIQKVRGGRLLRNHIKAMFYKLAYNSMRNKLSALIQFVTPIINITISSRQDLPRVRYEELVGATFSPGRVTAWFSNYGYHDSAVSLALADNALLSALAPGARLRV